MLVMTAKVDKKKIAIVLAVVAVLIAGIFLLFGGGIIFISLSGMESENLLLVCVSHK